ncbi:MAG: CopD family protein [Nitrospirae bacterium]|nr:CopD family protein [Nitrospirota bacterium]
MIIRRNVVVLIFLSIIIFSPTSGFCTTEYAGQTGRICSDCHVDPTGGGKLTQKGESFKDDLRIKGQYRVLNPAQHVIRFIIGYLHTMTAIVWFGTIIYVHIVLKPAYAAGGLPRGELMLGWGSIIIMAVTGTLLSIARVPTWQMLFHTRFGILLTIKVILFLIMVSTAVFVTFVVGPRLRRKKQSELKQSPQDLTHDQLSPFDGKEGRPAYVAYQGTIYDVSASRLWKDGSHFRKHAAGIDMTDVLKTAPHQEDKILNMPVIGKLIQGAEKKTPLQIRIFYFFAYMNLFLIFSIVFIISLWRWW